MTNDSLDLAITRHLKQSGLATEEQIQEAMRLKEESTPTGTPRSLSDILIEKGILTPVQRDNIEKKLNEQQSGGKKLLHYKLLRKLGEGGMGAVYLAEDMQLNRKVAVKVLPKKSGANAEFLTRFKREAEAAAALDHPNIAVAYATGEDQGYHFYVMEYCDGETVDKILKRERTLDPIKATDLVLQVARGLQCAHRKEFVHRDIKPSNILLTVDGTAKILDLGLTKNLAEGELSFRTVSGVALGTPHYISPEQAMGDRSIDGRADIYSLGASFYHFVTGKPPFEGPSAMEVMSQQVHAQVPNPQDLNEAIPDGVVHVLRKMMAKKPDDRYRDCAHLITDLEEVALGRPPKSQVLDAALSAVSPLRRRTAPDATARRRHATVRRIAAVRPPGKRSPLPLVAAGGAVLIAGLAAAFFLMGGDPPPPPQPQPAPQPPRTAATTPKPPPKSPVKPVPRAPAKQQPAAASPTEEQARRELERITRFDGLANDDIDGRTALLKKFIAAHPGTFASAQAQAMMNQLKSPIRRGPVDDQFVNAVSSLAPVDQLIQVVRKLRELNPGYDGKEQHRIEHGNVTSLALRSTEVSDLTPLRALRGLQSLDLTGTRVTNLTPLSGSGLRRLDLGGSNVSDLGPLQGVPLNTLNCEGTGVGDLSPLAGMRLRSLSVKNTAVRDLSPLRGMPLADLDCASTGVTDLSPLVQSPLAVLSCPFDRDRDAKVLLSIKTLRRINGQSVDEFWQRHGLRPPLSPRRDPARPPIHGAEPWPGAIDLLALIDTDQDTVAGNWKKTARGLVSDDTDYSRIQIPFRPPTEYDFRIVFSRDQGDCATSQILWKAGRQFAFHVGDYGNEWSGFSLVRDQDVKDNPTGSSDSPYLQNDRTYVSIVKVRNDGVSAWLNGKRIAAWATDYSDLSTEDGWALPREGVLGVGSCDNEGMIFHRIELLEVSGIGVPLRLGPWRPLFDGKTLDFLTRRGERSWDVRNGVLVKRKGLRQSAAQTVEAYGDGQIRIRFEASDSEYVSISVRQGGNEKVTLKLDRSQVGALGSGTHEAIFTCRGEKVVAHLDGEEMILETTGKPRAGHVQFNASKGTFRVFSLDYRELP